MDEIEQVSDDIAVIDEGKIILHDGKQAILTRADAVLISVEQMGETAVKELQQIDGIQVEKDGVHIKRDGRFNENMAAVFAVFHAPRSPGEGRLYSATEPLRSFSSS